MRSLAPRAGVGWTRPCARGLLAGIGFAMALFISSLALEGPALEASKVEAAKAGVLAASLVNGALGMLLMFLLPRRPADS